MRPLQLVQGHRHLGTAAWPFTAASSRGDRGHHSLPQPPHQAWGHDGPGGHGPAHRPGHRPLGNFLNREAFGAETALPWRMQLTTTAGELVEVHPTFLYESLWNLIGLLLIVFVVSKARRFDGENTCFYFLWYGAGRFWIEGLRTDSLYLFDWAIAGQPIRCPRC